MEKLMFTAVSYSDRELSLNTCLASSAVTELPQASSLLIRVIPSEMQFTENNADTKNQSDSIFFVSTLAPTPLLETFKNNKGVQF